MNDSHIARWRAAPSLALLRPAFGGGRAIVACALVLVTAACGSGSPAPADPPPPDAAEASAQPEILMSAPELPDLRLLTEASAEVAIDDLRGRPTLMTFIYTRCPMPEMCPATTLRFQQVQKALTAEQRQQVRLISVSFDPAYDTPEVLAEYAELWEADPDLWTFLTGTEEQVQALAAAYGVWYEKSDVDDTFRHPMYSMILMPDGSLHQVLLGSVFNADETAATLLSLTDDTGSTAH